MAASPGFVKNVNAISDNYRSVHRSYQGAHLEIQQYKKELAGKDKIIKDMNVKATSMNKQILQVDAQLLLLKELMQNHMGE